MKKKRHGFIWIVLIVIAAIVVYKSGKLDGVLGKEAPTEAETTRETKEEKTSETETEKSTAETGTEETEETETEETTVEAVTEETGSSETVPAETTEEAGLAEKAKDALTEAFVTPEFKAAMDSLEAFFDEYIDFMNKYKASDDTLSMLSEYTEYMKRYTDAIEKLYAIGDEELSDAETLYYLEVLNRIEEKLMKAALTY